jgi:hypothetical protein
MVTLNVIAAFMLLVLSMLYFIHYNELGVHGTVYWKLMIFVFLTLTLGYGVVSAMNQKRIMLF